jgi:isopentenyldiphosphate isomerase
MELIDQVDERDQVIGQTTREEAHSNGLIHRVSAIFVFNPSGKLFVQTHKEDQRLDHSVGGHVRSGETYEEAARRELKEELGLAEEFASVCDFYVSGDGRGTNRNHMFRLFECTSPSDWNFSMTEEVEVLNAMEISEIVKMMNINSENFTLGFLNSMANYIKSKGLDFSSI